MGIPPSGMIVVFSLFPPQPERPADRVTEMFPSLYCNLANTTRLAQLFGHWISSLGSLSPQFKDFKDMLPCLDS